MGLSDPFESTYAGAYKAGSSLGEGIKSAAGDYADVMKYNNQKKTQEKDLNNRRSDAFNTLKAAGMITEKTIPPTDDELKKGLEDGAKQAGITQVNWMESDDPKESRKSLENAYKTFGLPMPQGKKVIDYNLSPGTKYNPMKGEVEFDSPKSMLSQIGLDNLPDSMEVTGFDQKGQPMIRKKKEAKPPTAGQETTALYASRLKQSNDVFDKLENYINKQGAGEMAQASLPSFLNALKSEDMQSYQQAQKNFLNAVLRRESGAVISPSEFSEGKQQYFPQPGDKSDVIAQKKANRDLVMKNFISSARDAYVPYQDAAGEQIPAQSTQVEIPKGRVTVVSPDGKVGHIPTEQLDEAIKAGYKRQ